MNKDVSRRKFLALGSIATLSGAAFLNGCNSSNDRSAQVASDDATKTVTETKENKIAKEVISETHECDIAIVGAGAAGMWAAYEASKAGKNVLVIEKAPTVGFSNGSMAGGPFVVGSKLQKEAGIPFDVETAFKHIMDYGHWSINAPVVKDCVAISGETVDMFHDEFGLTMNLRPDNYGAGYDSVRVRFGEVGASIKGENRMGPIKEKVEQQGGKFIFEHAAEKLVKDGDKVTSVICSTKDGKKVEVKAKSILICTGGFLGNQEMMIEHYGTTVNPLGNTLSDGAGINAVLEVGGVKSTQWGIAGNEFGGSNDKNQPEWDRKNSAFEPAIYGALMVNKQGRRFADESKYANLPLAIGGAISLLGGRYFTILDEKYVSALDSGIDAFTLNGEDRESWPAGYMTIKGKAPKEFKRSIEEAIKQGWVHKADSIEELSKMIEAPALIETIEKYNADCAQGADSYMYKPTSFMNPVSEGPFYAFEYQPSAWVTLGGVRTNDKLQAIDEKGDIIEGLYVAGVDNGSILSAPYCDYEGTSLMMSYCSGRLAGKYMTEAI